MRTAKPTTAPVPTRHRITRSTAPAPLLWGAIALAGATLGAVGFHAPTPVRLALVLAFVLVVPGTAVMAWFPQPDVVAAWALTAVFGVTLTAGLVVLMLWGGFWNPALGLLLLSAISAGSIAVALSNRAGGAA